jgi:hypothetical protein
MLKNLKKIIWLKAFFFSIILFSIFTHTPSVYAVGEVCGVPNPQDATCCTPPQSVIDGDEAGIGCPAGTYWIGSNFGGQCQASALTCPASSFDCMTGTCTSVGGGTTQTCRNDQIHVGNNVCYDWLHVIVDNIATGANKTIYKLWFNNFVGNLVYLPGTNPICADGDTVGWDNTNKVWKCTKETLWKYVGAGPDIYYNTGKVGIGTATPSQPLDVRSAATAIFGVGGGSGYGVIGINADGGGVAGSSTNSGGVVGLSTNAGGVYGDGGSYGVYGNSASGYGVYGNSTSGIGVYASGGWGIYSVAGINFLNGNTGIGIADPGTYKLYVNGPTNISGSLTVKGDKSGMSALFVGLTNSSNYNGNQTNYSTADSRCSTDHPGSHICTSKEIINSYVLNVNSINSYTEKAWINSGAPGNITPAVSDCKGWSDGAIFPYFGTIWNFSIKAAGIMSCNKTRFFACCK